MSKESVSHNECYLKAKALLVASMFILTLIPMIATTQVDVVDYYTSPNQKVMRRNVTPTNTETERHNTIPSSNGGYWEDLNTGSSAGTSAEIYVSDSNNTGITIISNVYGFWWENITYNETIYKNIDLPAASPRSVVGQPQVPRLSFTLGIPSDVEITALIPSGNLELLDGFNITPAQIPSLGLENSLSPFVLDTDIYSVDQFYPDYNYSLSGQDSMSPIILRGRRLLQVDLYPLQVNPQTGELRAYTQFEIRIGYDHIAEIEPVAVNLQSKPFENFFERIALNYNDWGSTTTTTATSTTTLYTTTETEIFSTDEFPTDDGITISSYLNLDEPHYLIIAYDEFNEPALELAEWKTRKGIFTEVVLTSDIFPIGYRGEYFEYPWGRPTTEFEDYRIGALKEYIVETVCDMTPVPTYVLLFGDTNHIPCDYSTVTHTAGQYPPGTFPGHHGWETESRIPTDVTLFCVQGEDYLPEFFHGRISVENVDEAEYVVDKIIAYEQQPTDHDIFYNDILLSSYFDDWLKPMEVDEDNDGVMETVMVLGTDGIEDEPYVSTTEEVYSHLTSTPYSYSFHKNYVRHPDNLFPVSLFNGNPVSSITWKGSDLDWTTPSLIPPRYGPNTDHIIDNILDGRFLVYHIDHGMSQNYYDWLSPTGEQGDHDGWTFPYFTTNNFGNLGFSSPETTAYQNNLGKYPVILSMDCNTGWFDAETDGFYDLSIRAWDVGSPFLWDCFAEEILRVQNGGAVAVIAPTRLSFNYRASQLMKGITNAFWPGIITTSYPDDLQPPITNLGVALYLGKYYVENTIVDDLDDAYNKGTITNLIYHLFGDPETSLWTESPITLNAYPETVCYGRQELTITISTGDAPVEGAKVCIQKLGDFYEIGYTDSDGKAFFDINPSNRDPIQITATFPNAKPYVGSIEFGVDCPAPGLLALVVGAIGGAIVVIIIVVIIIIRKKK